MSKKQNTDNIETVINETFSHIKDIVDANTVVGKIINLGNDMYVLPVSKISVGLVSGGGNMPKSKNNGITAGSGTGFNIIPIGFITIANLQFNFLPVNSTVDMGKIILDNIFKIYEMAQNSTKSEEDNEKN